MDEWYKRTLEAGLSEAKERGDWDAAASATASARREDEDGRGRGTSESLTEKSFSLFKRDDAKTTTHDSTSSMDATNSAWDVGVFLNLGENGEEDTSPRAPRMSSNSDTMIFDLDDDPLASLLEMPETESALLFDGDAASISAALEAVADQIQAVSPNQAAAKAYVSKSARDNFTPRPSPLGLGLPAAQRGPAETVGSYPPGAFPPIMMPMSSDLFGIPRRVVSKERQAQLDRYRAKRERRLMGLKKVVRYECRKTLADARVRVKGRFVKANPDEKTSALKSFQSCPDLSALVEDEDNAKPLSFAPMKHTTLDDQQLHQQNSKRRISDDRLSNSDASHDDKLDVQSMRYEILRDSGAPALHPPTIPETLPLPSGLRRTKQMRHCQSEINLMDLAGY